MNDWIINVATRKSSQELNKFIITEQILLENMPYDFNKEFEFLKN